MDKLMKFGMQKAYILYLNDSYAQLSELIY